MSGQTYSANIGVKVGSIIKLKGRLNDVANRFCINLICGSDQNMMFAARFEIAERYVIRNDCVRGKWGSEERRGEMHLMPKDNFHIDIEFFNDFLTMTVDNKPVIRFNYRQHDVTTVTKIEVKYDASIQSSEVINRRL